MKNLKKKINSIDWILYLPENCTLQFKVTAKKSRLYHSDAVIQRCQAVISKQLGQTRPGKIAGAAQTIYIRADHDEFTVSIDTSGDILFKRGIKKKVSHAPLRENLAFAMLSWAGFSANDILIDPMCGSGTFSIEAAMIKSGLPPGFFRSFAFESWPAFSPKAFAYLKKQAGESIIFSPEKQIFASDTDENAVSIVKENIKDHGFSRMIEATQKDFFDILPPVLSSMQKGVIMLNPPYGKRLGSRYAAPSFFHEISKKLKHDFKGWHAGIILPDKECITALGLPLDFRPISHGGLEIFAGIGQI
ncbi:MAG: RNA methyltransferase [Proteobacteria bacterium]|nr:RNA methyltransferase [Pseudomonadota bacterium]